MPDWAEWVRVDTLLECYELQKETESALLEAMPDAYGGEAPGEDAWPEPDALRDRPYKLARIWSKLATDVQTDITAAYYHEHTNTLNYDGAQRHLR